MKLKTGEKAAYGLGAVGKDMVYMLSATYILYYYQDILGVSAIAMGVILMVARFFDAFNDPIMGVLVAKTKTRWGRFRPWLLIGTLTNSVLLYLLFAVPPAIEGRGLVAYASVTYILWGVTYTMMDIPFWSMIPAFTEGGRERERLTTLARSCAGIGATIITVITMKCVISLGGGNERTGFRYFSLIIAAAFIVLIAICCLCIKEKSTADMETPTVSQMFGALVRNDQAMAVVVTIVLVNCSLYITTNLLIYFFKYDFGGAKWYDSFTAFNTFGGVVQIASMMLLFPLLRRFISTIRVFFVSVILAALGYGLLLLMMFAVPGSIAALLIPALLIFSAFGMLTVLTTVFLANTVDYGELKNNRRDESVIFSMQTFVVKLASGAAAFITSVCLSICNLNSDTSTEGVAEASGSSAVILRLTMTALPIVGMAAAAVYFSRKYILTDKKLEEISHELDIRKTV